MPSARFRPVPPRPTSTRLRGAKRSVDYRIDDLILDVDAKRWDADIADSIVGGTYELTIEGATHVNLQVEDPNLDLLTSGTLAKWTWGDGWLGAPGPEGFFPDEDGWITKGREVRAQLDDLDFYLAKVAAQGTRLDLTLEDSIAHLLKRKTGARKAARSKVTRAEFVLSLVREVKYGGGIPVHIPELHVEQPIARSSQRVRDDRRHSDGRKGLDSSAHLTVKGAKATPEQRRNAERGLDVADSLNAPRAAKVALIAAYIVESTMRNLPGGLDDSVGILQVRVGLHGADVARSVERSTHTFLTAGFTGKGGAIKLARSGMSPAAIAQAVQGSAYPDRYAQVQDEAERFVNAYEGGGGRSSGEGRTKSFQFERKRDENSWDAIGRLAEEVRWRRFTRGGRLWYISEDRLFRQKPAYIAREGEDGVDQIDFEIDLGARNLVAEATVQARAERWTAAPGMVAVVRGKGPADGRWLVVQVSGDLFDEAATITLRKPIPAKPEPAAARAARARGSSGGVEKGSLRERIVSKAKKSLTSNTGHNYYSQGGAMTDDPTPSPPNRSDCSQWVRAIYLHAGAPDPGTWTGDQWAKSKPTSNPKPGDLVIYGEGSSSHHVELYVGGGKTIGHGSPPIDYGTPGMLSGGHFRTYDFLD